MPTLNISLQNVVSGSKNFISRWVATVDDSGISAKAKTKEEAIGELILKNQSFFGLAVVERQMRSDRYKGKADRS